MRAVTPAGRLCAVVTGASRGVGRGIAEGLAEAGATVYATGRDGEALAETAARVEALGGAAVPVALDHRDDGATAELFARVCEQTGRLDLLVNGAWGGYARMVEEGVYSWEEPFWRQPPWRWDAMFADGVRAAYACSREAATLMVPRRSGLIVNLSSWAAQRYLANAAYGVAKAATDRLTADSAHELRPFGVSVVSLYPGLVRTERVMEAADHFDLSNSESPRFSGRVVAALARDPELARLSGTVQVAAVLAQRFGVIDVDGSTPRPLTLAEV